MPRPRKCPPIICDNFTWHLCRKPSGVYFADVRSNRGYSLGKPSLNTKDHATALRRLKDLDHHVAVQHGLLSDEKRPVSADLPISDGWQLYMDRCEQPEILGGVSPATQERYRPVRDKHKVFCQHRGYAHWSAITKKSTKEYGLWLAKRNASDRTIVLELNLVCSVVKWLVEEEHLPASCQFQLKLSKPEGTTTYCYTRDQMVRMIEFCRENPELEWLGLVIFCLATSGVRINELTRLRWSDIDLQAGTLRLTDERATPRRRQTGSERRIKGKRGRAIPIHPELRKILETMPRHRDGRVFHAQRGGPVRDRRVLEVLQTKVIATLQSTFPTPPGERGFQDGTVHGLRHYFVSEAFRAGATEAELLEWVGHRDSEILKIYRHLRPEDGHRRMNQINFLGRDDEGESNGYVA